MPKAETAEIEVSSLSDSSLSRQVVEAMAREFGTDYLMGKLRELLECNKPIYHKGVRVDKGDIIDGELRFKVAKFIIEMTAGSPVRRQEIVHAEITGEEELYRRLQKTPSFRHAMRRMLEQAEEDAANDPAQKTATRAQKEARREGGW